jgi:hypothetical protein
VTDIAVVAFASRQEPVIDDNEIELIGPIIEEVRAATGLGPGDIDFTCSGSSDFLAGAAFSFVGTLDATRPVPPIVESHVEMDGAWALYEAWVIPEGAGRVKGYGPLFLGALGRELRCRGAAGRPRGVGGVGRGGVDAGWLQ